MVRVVKSLSYRKAGIGFGRRIDSSAEESNLQPKNQIFSRRISCVLKESGLWNLHWVAGWKKSAEALAER